MSSRRRFLAVVAATGLAGCGAPSDGRGDATDVPTTATSSDAGGADEADQGDGGPTTGESGALGEPPSGAGVRWTVRVGTPVTARPVVAGDVVFLGSGQHDEGREPDVDVRTRPLKPSTLHGVSTDGWRAFRYRAPAPVLDVAPVGDTGAPGAYAIVGWYGGAGGISHRLTRIERGRPVWQDAPRDANRFIAAATTRTVVSGTRDEHVSLTGERVTARDRAGFFQWRRESGDVIAGTGHGDRVYLTVGTRETWCLAARTGRVAWRYRGTPPTWHPNVLGGASEVLFVARTDRDDRGGQPLVALDAATGQVRWQFAGDGSTAFTPGSAVEIGAIPSTATGGTADEVVCVGSTSGTLHGLDPATGEHRWSFELSGRVDEGPELAGGTAFVLDTHRVLYAVDVRRGRERWRLQTDVPGRALAATDRGVLVVGGTADRDRGNRYRVVSVGTDGAVQYRNGAPDGLLAAVVADGEAYVVTESGYLARFAGPN